MEKSELGKLAERLHKQFGKKYHTPQEALAFLLPLWEENNDITVAVLFNLASAGSGKNKSHASATGESGKLKPVGFVGRGSGKIRT